MIKLNVYPERLVGNLWFPQVASNAFYIFLICWKLICTVMPCGRVHTVKPKHWVLSVLQKSKYIKEYCLNFKTK